MAGDLVPRLLRGSHGAIRSVTALFAVVFLSEARDSLVNSAGQRAERVPQWPLGRNVALARSQQLIVRAPHGLDVRLQRLVFARQGAQLARDARCGVLAARYFAPEAVHSRQQLLLVPVQARQARPQGAYRGHAVALAPQQRNRVVAVSELNLDVVQLIAQRPVLLPQPRDVLELLRYRRVVLDALAIQSQPVLLVLALQLRDRVGVFANRPAGLCELVREIVVARLQVRQSASGDVSNTNRKTLFKRRVL